MTIDIMNIDIIKSFIEWDLPMDCYITLDKAKKLFELQIPKKTIKKTIYNKYIGNYCPNCNNNISRETSPTLCKNCGQRLLWEE